ncbi:substrate-binding domain-containing protein, partial [Beijerinckia sp. L45]|uniref:substrate-binding domain-containing protein n=1 Tax=Beijerinckia sp. L45 TaxID=1641855 RepID=UPI00131D1C1B
YLRGAAILVRKGNPASIQGIADLLKSGHRILVVDGAGQQGLWEDVSGRLGDVASVRAFRANIAVFAKNSGDAKKVWQSDLTIDAWLIWTIWQTANPDLADQVAIEPERQIFRDMGVAMTRRGETHSETAAFVAFLRSDEGASIFKKFGWIAP